MWGQVNSSCCFLGAQRGTVRDKVTVEAQVDIHIEWWLGGIITEWWKRGHITEWGPQRGALLLRADKKRHYY